MWRSDVGMFCPGTLPASTAGLEAITAPRDVEGARGAIREAGYREERVVLLAATDIASSKAAAEVTAACSGASG